MALLFGAVNTGMCAAQNLGAVMMHILEIKPTGMVNESHQFKNLWITSVWNSTVPPAVLVLLLWLLPQRRMDEHLLEDVPEAATAGSPWKRFLARRRAAEAAAAEVVTH